MIAQLISIGNELTGGQTVDTNSAWLARELAAVGVRCTKHITIADELEPIRAALLDATKEAELIIVTGGLGPTPDDLTRDALAAAMQRPLQLHEPSLARIADYFRSRGRSMHDANRLQAMMPEGAEPIDNAQGTAPGIRVRLAGALVFCLPGVPYEMKAMFERDVRPHITAGRGAAVTIERVLRTFGMSESEVGQRIGDLMRRDRNPTVGTSAADLVISIRIVAQAASLDVAEAVIDEDARAISERLGNVVYGEGDETLQSAVGRLLIERGLTIATAESCTGGLVAKRLTDVPGSSAYMLQGFVTYSNESKTRLLGVPADRIAAHGAVSREIAEAMASAARRLSESDFAIGITGIAGPSGGTSEKPVGLVYVALASADGTIVKELRLGDNLRRDQVRDRTVKAALNLLRLSLVRDQD